MPISIDSYSKVSGLSSGLDTETIVKGLITPYQTKVDKQAQATTKLEWTADAYREINTLIKNFRSKYLSVLSDSNMLSENSYSNLKVSMLTETGTVSLSAASAASAGTYTINSITQLAAAAKAGSKGVFTGAAYSSDTTLANLELANKFSFDENGEISFSINGEPFTFTKDTTNAAMMKEINSSDAGVTMKYSSLTKGFTITSNTTGSTSKIAIVNTAGNAFTPLNSSLGISQGIYSGQDAVCSIEGIPVTQPSNTFSYDGVTYTLNNTSETPIQFSVEQDYQSTVDSITAFVDAYNGLMDSLQSKVVEKVYYDYPPLTDSQKEEMTDDQVKQWEDKAKSGLLHGDSYVSSLLTTLRSAFYTKVESAGMSPADIGLTTGVYSDGAKITVNKDKLLNAIKKDPQSVKNIFVQTSETRKFSEEGLMMRISDGLLNYTKQTTDVALDSLETKITESTEMEGELETKMSDKEEALWKKFAAMETALSKLNSMNGWLSSLFPASSS